MTDDLAEWILSFEKGKIWYNKISNSKATLRKYLTHFKEYCDAVGKNPDQLIDLKMEGQRHVGENIEYQAEELLENYVYNAKLTNDMKVGAKTAVLSFYKHNRRHLQPDTASNIERGEAKKRCPAMNDIIDLDNAMVTQRDKALLWFIASAPFRVGSISKLKWKDLKPTKDNEVPFYLKIEAERLKGSGRGKYKGVKQIGFLHSLAVEKLESYKKELERKGYEINNNSPIFIAYRQKGKVKPYSPWSIEGMFTDASLKAWHDLETKRFSPHDLRSFVQSQLENKLANPNIIKPILGHKPKGVDKHYSEHDISDFLEKFKSALPFLMPQSIEELKAETDKDQRRISELEKQVDEMPTKIREELEKLLPEIKKLYAKNKK
jgi:integrase